MDHRLARTLERRNGRKLGHHRDDDGRVAEKAGFALEGTMLSALIHTDGWHDMHVHALLAG